MTKKTPPIEEHIKRNLKIAKMCLSPKWTGKFNEFERGLLASVITHDYSPKIASEALAGDADALLRLLNAERVISVMTGISDTHRVHVTDRSAKNARDARASSDEEKALLDAIESKHGNKKSEKPFKDAGAILKEVNERLAERNFPPVSVNVIYRRLKDFPWTVRS